MRFEAVRVRSIFYDAEEQKMPSNVVTKTTSPEGKAETERPIDTLGRERERPTATAFTEPDTYPFDGTLKPRKKEKTL